MWYSDGMSRQRIFELYPGEGERKVTLRLPESIAAPIERAARKEGRSLQAEVTLLFVRTYGRDNPPESPASGD
jgi:hypothetical protein